MLRWHTRNVCCSTRDRNWPSNRRGRSSPRHHRIPAALLILGSALRQARHTEAALETLRPLALSQPRWAAASRELGFALGDAGHGEDAVATLRTAVKLQPAMADAWRALGDHLNAMGDTQGADAAYASHVRASTRDPRLLEPALALSEGRIAAAEPLLRSHLKKYPTDVAAIRMLAEVAARIGRYDDAQNLLTRCLELAPGFHAARHNLAVVLHRDNKPREALTQIDRLLQAEPDSPGFRNLRAAVLARIGEFAQALELYERLLQQYPSQSKLWLSYGHALKTAGRQADAVAAYRNAWRLEPTFGDACWSLANLKTFRFDAADRAAMRQQVESPAFGHDDRLHFHFALGKAFEDEKAYADSFQHYAAGNRLRKQAVPYVADELTDQVRRTTDLFTPGFLGARAGQGMPGARPDLHRGAAPLGIDAGRADTFQPSVRGRHDGAARRDRHRQGPERSHAPLRGDRAIPRFLPNSAATSCAHSVNVTWSRPGSSARPRHRSSSTRCRTTGRTSA